MKRLLPRFILWTLLFVVVIGWPPIYSILVHPQLYPRWNASYVSTEEFKKLLDVRRYTIDIPMELDGHFLTFDTIVDGKTTQGGGSSVEGGSQVILLLRRNHEARKIEFCWIGSNAVSRGVLDDPLVGASTSTARREGSIAPGDWLLRGGRSSVQVFPATEPAEFELRLAFSPP